VTGTKAKATVTNQYSKTTAPNGSCHQASYNGDVIGYTTIELFEHLIEDQYVQPEDLADQVTEMHKQLEQKYDPSEEPQVYYKAVQDAKLTLESLNQSIDEETLIRHGMNQFKGHMDLRHDIKAWKKSNQTDKTWKKFKSHFTKAINDNRNDLSTLKAESLRYIW
jgi:hypothetical protein